MLTNWFEMFLSFLEDSFTMMVCWRILEVGSNGTLSSCLCITLKYFFFQLKVSSFRPFLENIPTALVFKM